MSRIETKRATATASVHGGRDDDADADRHGAHEHRERQVLLAHNLVPQVVGRHPIDNRERRDEHDDAEEGEDDRRPDVVQIHHLPPVKCRNAPYAGRYEPGLSRTDWGTARPWLIHDRPQPR